MKKNLLLRPCALFLAASLLLAPAANALTPDQARELLREYYIDEIPEDILSKPTVEEMLEALGDPYTQYFTPEEYQAFLDSMLDTNTVGVGISFTKTENGLLLSGTVPGSSAEAAGLLEGDLITEVDGVSVLGLDTDALSGMIGGEEGTSVGITYLRDGVIAQVTLDRAAFVVPATTTDLLNGHIGYISCTTFGDQTVGHFADGISTYADQVDRWIVDLRTNGGGSVDAAVNSVGLFTGQGRIAYLQNGEGQFVYYGYDQDAAAVDPVIVLSDQYTASSSELFSASIRDMEAGIVLGWRTYGKGVAQSLIDQDIAPEYFQEGGGLKLTTARYYSPNGTTTDTVGVIPHLLITPRNTSAAALLLSAAAPEEDTTGYLRLDLSWRWYIDLETALSEPYIDAFTELLEAIPPNVELRRGTGGPNGWRPVSPAAAAGEYGLDYQSRGFSDAESSPFQREINILGTYGIVSGAGNGSYEPDGILTRAQLCVMLAQALACRVPQGESQFSDVSMETWYGPAINALANMGLVGGVGDGLFRPEDPVDHQQFITIMSRVAQRLNMVFKFSLEEMPQNAADHPDLAAFAPWAREHVWLLSKSQEGELNNDLNLLWLAPQSIDPSAATTRGEAAALVYSVMSYVGLLPV